MKEETRYLWISELPPNTTQDSLIQIFSTYGRVLSTKIHEVGNVRGAVLSFLDTKAAAKACADTYKLEVLGLTSEYCDQHGEPGLQRLKDSPHSKNSDSENRRPVENGPASVGSNGSSASTPVSSRGKSNRHDSQSRSLRGLKVWNFPDRSSDSSIRDGLFHEYKKIGKVISIVMKGEKDERYAVISFKRSDEADKAFDITKNGKSFFGMILNVERHEPYPEDPDLHQQSTGVPEFQGFDEYHTRATKTLFVGNLDAKLVTTDELQEIFQRFGHILEIDIKGQNNTNVGSGNASYAFVQFSDIRSVVNALEVADTVRVCNQKVKLGFGKSQPMNCIWIANLADSVNESFLAKTFSTFGPVKSVLINFQRKRALIYFETADCGQAAVTDMKNRCIAGKKVQIDFASQPCQQHFVDELIKSGQYSGWKNYKIFEQLFDTPDFHRQIMSRKAAARYFEQRREMMLEYMKAASVSHRGGRRKFRDHISFDETSEGHNRGRHDDFYDSSSYPEDYKKRLLIDQMLWPKDRGYTSRDSYNYNSSNKHVSAGSPTGSQKSTSRTHSKDGDNHRRSHSPNHRTSNNSSTSSSPVRNTGDLRSILDRSHQRTLSRRSSSKSSKRSHKERRQQLRSEVVKKNSHSTSDSNVSSEDELVSKGSGANDKSLQKLEREKQMLLAQLANLECLSDSSPSDNECRAGIRDSRGSERSVRPICENSSPDKLRTAADSSGSTSSKPFSGDDCHSPKDDPEFDGSMHQHSTSEEFRCPNKLPLDDSSISNTTTHEDVDATIKFLRQVSEQNASSNDLTTNTICTSSTTLSQDSTSLPCTTVDTTLRDPRLVSKTTSSLTSCTNTTVTTTTNSGTSSTCQQTQDVLNKLLRNLVASNKTAASVAASSSNSSTAATTTTVTITQPQPPSFPPPPTTPSNKTKLELPPLDDADRELEARIKALDAKIPFTATAGNKISNPQVDYSKFRIRKRSEPRLTIPSNVVPSVSCSTAVGSNGSTGTTLTASTVTTASPIPDTSEFVKSMLFPKSSVFDHDAKRLEQAVSAATSVVNCSGTFFTSCSSIASSTVISGSCSTISSNCLDTVSTPLSVTSTPLSHHHYHHPSPPGTPQVLPASCNQPTTPIRSILKAANPPPLTLTPTTTTSCHVPSSPLPVAAPSTPQPRLPLTSSKPTLPLQLNQNIAKRKHSENQQLSLSSSSASFSLPEPEVKKPKLHSKPERLSSFDDTLFKPDTTLVAQPNKKRNVDRTKSDNTGGAPKLNKVRLELPSMDHTSTSSSNPIKPLASPGNNCRKQSDTTCSKDSNKDEPKKKSKHNNNLEDGTHKVGGNPSSDKHRSSTSASTSSSKISSDHHSSKSKSASEHTSVNNSGHARPESKAERLFDQIKSEKIEHEDKPKLTSNRRDSGSSAGHDSTKKVHKTNRLHSGEKSTKARLNVDDVFGDNATKKRLKSHVDDSLSERFKDKTKRSKKDVSSSSSSSASTSDQDEQSSKWKPAPVSSRGTPSSANTNSWELEFFGQQLPYESMYDKIKRRQATRQSHDSVRTPKSADEKKSNKRHGKKKLSKTTTSSSDSEDNDEKKGIISMDHHQAKKIHVAHLSDEDMIAVGSDSEEDLPQLFVHTKKMPGKSSSFHHDSCNEADDEEDLESKKKAVRRRLEKAATRRIKTNKSKLLATTPKSSSKHQQYRSRKNKMSVDSVYSDQSSSDTDPSMLECYHTQHRRPHHRHTSMMDEAETPKTEPMTDESQVESCSDAGVNTCKFELKRSCLTDMIAEARAQLDPRSVTEKSLFNFSDDGFVPTPDLPTIERIQPDSARADNDDDEPPNLAVDPVEVVVGSGNERETAAAEALAELSQQRPSTTAPLILGRIPTSSAAAAPSPILRPLIPAPSQTSPTSTFLVHGKIAQPPVALATNAAVSQQQPSFVQTDQFASSMRPTLQQQHLATTGGSADVEKYVRDVIQKVRNTKEPNQPASVTTAIVQPQISTTNSTPIIDNMASSLKLSPSNLVTSKKTDSLFDLQVSTAARPPLTTTTTASTVRSDTFRLQQEVQFVPSSNIINKNTTSTSSTSSSNNHIEDIFKDVLERSPKSVSAISETTTTTPPASIPNVTPTMANVPAAARPKTIRNPPKPMEASALAHVDEIIEEVASGCINLDPYMDREKYRKRYHSGDLSSTPLPATPSIMPTPPVTVTPDIHAQTAAVSATLPVQEIRSLPVPVVCTTMPTTTVLQQQPPTAIITDQQQQHLQQPHIQHHVPQQQQQLVVATAPPPTVSTTDPNSAAVAAAAYAQQTAAVAAAAQPQQQIQPFQLQAMYLQQYFNNFGVPTTDISSFYPNPYLLFQHPNQPPVQQPPQTTQPGAQWGSQLEALLRKYPVKWQGKMALKNDEVSVQMHFVFGSEPLVKSAMDLASCGEPPLLKIVQRMRMEAVQLEGVQRKMTEEPEFCMLLAVACGLNAMDYRRQTQALREAFIKYLQEKQAAGIVNVNFPTSGDMEAPAYVVHIFPPGQFAAEKLKQYADDLYANLFPQPHTETPHLLVVITTV